MTTTYTPPEKVARHPVPYNRQFAYIAPGSRVITAIIEWQQSLYGTRESAIYALVSEGVPAALPKVMAEDLGNCINALRRQGCLIALDEAITQEDLAHIYRVRDLRTGGIFAVWHGSYLATSRYSMVPCAVYGYFPSGRRPKAPNTFPRLFTPTDLERLVIAPGTAVVNITEKTYHAEEYQTRGYTIIVETFHPW